MRMLVTGAASGIGKATAEEAADRGHEVIALDREDMEFENSRITFRRADTYSPEAEEIVREEDFEALVNCAGYYEQGSIEDMPVQTVEEIFRSNVFGLLRVTRSALPVLRENNGRIVNVSSVAGRITLPYSGQYCASKKAVEAISDALRMEVRDQGIDVVVVEPGIIDTGFNERARKALEKYLPDSIYAEKYGELLEKEGMEGVNAEVPARKIVDIIETDNPGRRYQSPLRAKILVSLGRLPHLLKDRIMDRVY